MRVPLQHITGLAHFRTVSLAVGPGVFIPRPETEVVVEFALAMLHESANRTPLVVDLCAGSGAIALAIATEFPGARVHAVENDPGALPWLRRNVKHVDVMVSESDIDGCLDELTSQFDLVIANPPYIPTDAVPRELEVARHDPGLALYSGADGLDHIRTVERTAARLLRPDGIVVVEHADEQGQSAPQIFRDAREWGDVCDHRDLTGRDRYLSARRTSAKTNR
jgi:release factor glutamine methyltransferase